MTPMQIHDPLPLLVQRYGELAHTFIYPEVISETFKSGMAQVDTVYKVS